MSEPDRTKLPIRRPSFQGVSNRTLAGSEPDWNVIGASGAAGGAPECRSAYGTAAVHDLKGLNGDG
jgi:hypothetical protein